MDETKRRETQKYLNALEKILKIEKCRECECLQGALTQLRIDVPPLKGKIDKLLSGNLHKCLGCKPCTPADLWEERLKESQ